jgi:uncharacterized protein YbaA (DUF1428 family)
MAGYVDGYVLPIPKKHLQVYRRMAQKAGKIWREPAPSTTRSARAMISILQWECHSLVR